MGSHEHELPLLDYLTDPHRLAALLPSSRGTNFGCYPLPNLLAVNVVIVGLLGNGVAASLREDPQAKSLGERFRARTRPACPRRCYPNSIIHGGLTCSSPTSTTSSAPACGDAGQDRRTALREVGGRGATFPAHELFAEFAKLGLLGLEYDPAYGGEGADHWFTVIACEEFGRLPGNGIPDGLQRAGEHGHPSLHAHGSDELKREFLAPAIAGEQICSIAVTEPDAGFGRRGHPYPGRARRWRLADQRRQNLYHQRRAGRLAVPARAHLRRGRLSGHEPGDRARPKVPGLTVSRSLKKLGNWCSDTAELTFDRVRVPVRNTIGEIGRGFQQQMEQFQKERISAVYQAVGQMETAIERTVDYLRTRPAFGGKLIDNQYLQYNLAELACEVDALKLLRALVRRDDRRRCRRHPPHQQREIVGRKVDSPGRRHLHAVSRRHGLHGRDVDVPVLPGLPAAVDRRRRRRGHAAGAGARRHQQGILQRHQRIPESSPHDDRHRITSPADGANANECDWRRTTTAISRGSRSPIRRRRMRWRPRIAS